MALSSTSTLADALAQYNDNLSWDLDRPKAAAALEAVRWLLVNRPMMSNAQLVSLNFGSLEAEKAKLEALVQSQSASGGSNPTRTSFVSARPQILPGGTLGEVIP